MLGNAWDGGGIILEESSSTLKNILDFFTVDNFFTTFARRLSRNIIFLFYIMKFVDRTRELKKVDACLDSPESKLIVIYGRRRIGKSTLIKRAIRERHSIYFQADETQMTNQLSLLSKAVAHEVPGFDNVIYPDWYSLLEALNYRVVPGTVLCLDEFPYLVKSFTGLPSVLQNFEDNANPNFKIILCGSSQQSMHSDVLNENSPLYGRADLILKLQPLKLGYISEAMGLSSAIEAIKYYSVWGGVPRYWSLCLGYEDFKEAFTELFLQPEATLADEPNRLLRDDMRDLTLSRTIMSVIGDGANRMSEIAARVGKGSAELTGPIKKLIDMGYITKDVPFGESPKKSKRTLYKITDQFLSSYYRFVAPNASLISIGRTEALWSMAESRLSQFIGSSWEELCRQAVSGNTIDGILYSQASRWWGTVPNRELKINEHMELDVVAESIDGRTLLIGECKWTTKENACQLLESLKNKSGKLPFIANYSNVVYALFLKEEPINQADCICFMPDDIAEMLR